MPQQRLPRWRGFNSAFTAFEQRRTEAHLDVGDPFADRGWRNECPFAGPCDGAFLADQNEQVQGEVIQMRHYGFPSGRGVAQARYTRQIESVEANIYDLISQGKTFEETRTALGYHSLQRKV